MLMGKSLLVTPPLAHSFNTPRSGVTGVIARWRQVVVRAAMRPADRSGAAPTAANVPA